MTENGEKNGELHKVYLAEKHQRKKDSDREQNDVLNFRFDNQASGSKEMNFPEAVNSFVQEGSPREIEDSYSEKNDSTSGTGFSKKSSGLRHSKDNSNEKKTSKVNKMDVESSGIPTKTKSGNDVRNFKSMTIGRMGKMLKLKSSNFEQDEFAISSQDQGEAKRVSYLCDQPTRKEKTNSLGRMFKLMDKDISPRRIFSQSKSESSNRFWKTNSPMSKEEKPKSDDRIRRAFSKMLSQIRGRAVSANTSAEPNLRTSDGKSKGSLPPRPPLT